MTASSEEKSGAIKEGGDSVERAQSLTIAEDDGNSKTVNEVQLDEAAKYLVNAENYGPLTPEAEKKLVRKLDRWMLPMVSCTPSAFRIIKHGQERQVTDNASATCSSYLQQPLVLLTRSRLELPLSTVSRPITICTVSNIAGWGASCL